MFCAAAPRAAPAAPDAALALSGPLTSSPRTQGRSRCGLLCGFAATGVPVHVRGPRGTACQHWRFVCGAAGAGVRRPRAPPPPPERQPAQDGKGPLSSVSSLHPPKLALCMRLLRLPRHRRGARSCCPALTSTPSIRPPRTLRRVLPRARRQTCMPRRSRMRCVCSRPLLHAFLSMCPMSIGRCDVWARAPFRVSSFSGLAGRSLRAASKFIANANHALFRWRKISPLHANLLPQLKNLLSRPFVLQPRVLPPRGKTLAVVSV